MRILKLPTSPLYSGLARIFVVIAVVWTGLILFWVRDESFNVTRPDAKTVERVDRWFAEISMLSRSDSEKFDDLPAERRSLIRKAADTGAYHINGREQKLTVSELKGYKAILENGFSEQVKVTMVRAGKNVEPARSLSGLEYSDRYISDTPVWDFRGVRGLGLEALSHMVRGITYQFNEIQISEGMERHFAFGMVEKFKPSGEFTGLVTEEDLSLLDDLRTALKNRRMLKPLFWVAAWIVPLLGVWLATLIAVQLCRWIARGFRPTAQNKP